MCVHLLFGLMLLGSKYLSYVCQSYKKPGSVTICNNFKHPIFSKKFYAIRPLFWNVLFFTLKQA